MSLTCITGFAGFSVTSKWNGSDVSGPDGTTRRCRLSLTSSSIGPMSEVKLVREIKVEQHRLAGGLLQLFEIEAVAECGDLLREVVGPDRNCMPIEAVPRQREDVALLVSGQEEDQRLIGAEQLLHVLGLERLWACECRIFRELPFKPPRVGHKPALGRGKLFAQCCDRGRVLLTLRFCKGRKERLVALAPQDGQVLTLAYQYCECIGARGKAQAHLLHRGRGRGLFCPLRHDESFTPKFCLRLKPLLRRRGKTGDMTNKKVRALLDETAPSLLVLRAARLGGCVSYDGSRRFARIGKCALAVTAAGEEDGQVVEGCGHIGVVSAERFLPNRQRSLVERLGFGVLALRLVHVGQVVEGL